MNYADVAIDADWIPPGKTFSYRVPRHLAVEPGQLVWVQFGRNIVQGLVLSLADASAVSEEETRDILHPVEPSPLVGSLGLELAEWLGQTYRCSPFEAVAPMLPPGFRAQQRSRLTAISGPDDTSELASFRESTRGAWRELADSTRAWEEIAFLKRIDPTHANIARRELQRLVSRGFVSKEVSLPRSRTHRYRRLLIPGHHPEAGDDGADPPPMRGARQVELLAAVRESTAGYDTAGAASRLGPAADALLERGLVAEEWHRAEHEIPSGVAASNPSPDRLTAAQNQAVTGITAALDNPGLLPRSFLLHGVTGSGKTEVYLRAIAHAVGQGKQAIYLVPEIALTPQTVGMVNDRFPGRVAVLHHRLTERQRFEQWWNIRDGLADVIVGPRSALFAPTVNLGIIVVDEEHEPAYKQDEHPPNYHARDTALALARRSGAVVVMGSATPDVSTYYEATRGRHHLLRLPERVPRVDGDPTPLPEISVVDMRRELREGNRSVFSRSLTEALDATIARGRQAILFLNRRGSAAFMQCRDCGCVINCSRCSVSYAFHRESGRLICHYCNRQRRLPRACPQCRGGRIREMGAGTETITSELQERYPGVVVERWDSDSVRNPQELEAAMERLAGGQAQILVGTQMVARGLDLPNVTLSAVLLADLGLNLPDFRAGERAFALLCQVAGRSGRGHEPGRAIIQTYQPDHYAIAAAAEQDYAAFYGIEIAARRLQGNPPFNRLAQVICADLSVRAAQQTLGELAQSWGEQAAREGRTDLDIIGPTPCLPERVRGRYRWRLLLRGRRIWQFLEGRTVPRNCRIDVDPVRLD
ncbi:MAG: primosomal protein N' [Chloroflexota bacterium]|nr:primosomal protein N' [Chloroflexota bacterium]MDE2960848.1 primosomal protein N' [Chloroflexota bacterium]